MAGNFNIEMKKISELDKKIRMVIGGVLIAGVVIGAGQLFFVIIGGLLIASGYTGQCALSKYLGDKK
jgi:hypothetical protein